MGAEDRGQRAYALFPRAYPPPARRGGGREPDRGARRLRPSAQRPSLALGLHRARTALSGDRADADWPERPVGPLVWVDVAEGDLLPAMEGFRRALAEVSEAGVLVTSDAPPDPAGACLTAARPPGGAEALRGFLARMRPDLALFLGRPVTPLAVTEAGRAGLAVFLAAADAPAWGVWRGRVERAATLRADAVFARDAAAAGRLGRLGVAAARLEVLGPLLEGPAPPDCDASEREAVTSALAGRPAWLAAGIAGAEEEAVVTAAHSAARARAHRLLLILAPADPARGPVLAAGLRGEGWRVARRAAAEEPDEETEIYLADRAGELGLWYRVAPVCFLGGTLASGGTLRPFGPAALGSAVIHGPDRSAAPDQYARLAAAGAARCVGDAGELGATVLELVAPDRAAEMAHAAWDVTSEGAPALDRLAEAVAAALDARADSGGGG